MAVVQYLMKHTPFCEHLQYAPIIEKDSKGEKIYSEMWMGEWWHKMQVKCPKLWWSDICQSRIGMYFGIDDIEI